MCATRLFRISAANIGPNRFHQNRTISWLISIPRSAKRSSTLRKDSGYLTYIITTRRMTSGELLKYRNGCSWPKTSTAARGPKVCSDRANVLVSMSAASKLNLLEVLIDAEDNETIRDDLEAIAHRLRYPMSAILRSCRPCQSNGAVDMQRDRDVASGDLCRESAPLSKGSTAPLLVDLPRDEMALLIELVVHLGVN